MSFVYMRTCILGSIEVFLSPFSTHAPASQVSQCLNRDPKIADAGRNFLVLGPEFTMFKNNEL